MSPIAANESFSDATATVVIVGGGTVGSDACTTEPNRTSTGKADGLQPKTIETLKQLRLADPLLRNGVKVYDISFWDSSPSHALCRKARQIHYPDHLVGASDPYILLAHQGMLESVLNDDLKARGVSVQRNRSFLSVSRVRASEQLDVIYEDRDTQTKRVVRADYLVGCDGARSRVRSFIPDAELEGETTNASWGVLDGVIETDFPDLWSKVAVRSHAVGSILWIPRERSMTRLYVELSSTEGERIGKAKATPEYVMARAKEVMKPFHLEWKEIEWFGNYIVGQRVARHFADPNLQIFIAGDAGHVHSALAAQGANTSMHDSFNLSWKLNLVSRGLVSTFLLTTYETERRKVANDLIAFDAGHCAAFEQGDEALARNFDENIRLISGVRAEYTPNLIVRFYHQESDDEQNEQNDGKKGIRAGALLLPAKVTRYIDANPVDIQLDIPLLGQFRVYFLISDMRSVGAFLDTVCLGLTSGRLARASSLARQPYRSCPRIWAERDEYVVPGRYTAVLELFTLDVVTGSAREEFEIADLPQVLQRESMDCLFRRCRWVYREVDGWV